MPKKSPILLITGILGLLAIGGVAFMSLMPSGPSEPVGPPQPTPTPIPLQVYVANRDIPPRTEVNSTMFRLTSLTGAAPADALRSSEDIQKLKGQLTKTTIYAGETLTLASFGPRLRRVQPANFEVPINTRAISVYAEIDSTIAGLLDVGDRVDVVSTHRLKWDKQENQYVDGALEYTAGRLIASNLRVLAVDASIKAPTPTPTPVPGTQNPAVAAAGAGAGAPPPPPPPPPGPAVTKTRVVLAAPPLLATQIVAAADQGTITLLLRNPSDSDAAQIPEQRQYPSRLITGRSTKRETQNAGSTGGTRLPRIADIAPPRIPEAVPIPTTAPSEKPFEFSKEQTVTPTPIPSEITVIRGTEKTRVLVPQR